MERREEVVVVVWLERDLGKTGMDIYRTNTIICLHYQPSITIVSLSLLSVPLSVKPLSSCFNPF
jgi:hypothetical protein